MIDPTEFLKNPAKAIFERSYFTPTYANRWELTAHGAGAYRGCAGAGWRQHRTLDSDCQDWRIRLDCVSFVA